MYILVDHFWAGRGAVGFEKGLNFCKQAIYRFGEIIPLPELGDEQAAEGRLSNCSWESLRLSLLSKIDYYHRNLEFHSPDPADPVVTVRVLTIMCVEEY